MDILKSMIVFQLLHCQIQTFTRADPCENYISSNDTTMNVAYTADGITNTTCRTLEIFKWYRYTGTDEGHLTDSCPQDLQCGSSSQVWFNDSVPFDDEGEVFKIACIRKGSNCCASKTHIRAKNCSDFLVYFIIPVPDCAHYCYEAPDGDTINSAHHESSNNNSVPIWVWIVVSICVVSFSFVGIFVFARYKKKSFRQKTLHTHEGDVSNNVSPRYEIKRTRFNTTSIQ